MRPWYATSAGLRDSPSRQPGRSLVNADRRSGRTRPSSTAARGSGFGAVLVERHQAPAIALAEHLQTALAAAPRGPAGRAATGSRRTGPSGAGSARRRTFQRLATTDCAPATWKARCSPSSPSPPATAPSPVSHADSTASSTFDRSSSATSRAVRMPSSLPERGGPDVGAGQRQAREQPRMVARHAEPAEQLRPASPPRRGPRAEFRASGAK